MFKLHNQYKYQMDDWNTMLLVYYKTYEFV